jgi:hypothetical protein
MNPQTPCDALARTLSQLFVCEPHGDFQRVRTPYLYPDGDHIDLFCKTETDGTITVSDLGETSRWLRMQTVSTRRSSKQQALIEDIKLTHGVEFYKGMLLARCRAGDDFASVLTRLAQAALRTSDIWFTFRTRSVESVTDEVQEFFEQRQIQSERGEKLLGRSGKTWTVDFHTRTSKRSCLVDVLGTGSRSAARSVVEHVFTTWYDLSHLKVGPEALTFVSLFDDTVDVWSEEDFRLVEEVSTVARWSDPDGFEKLVRAA